MPDQFILSPSQLGNLLTSLQPHYPNQEEITSPSISYKTATIMAVKGWRNNTWKTAKSGDEATKITALQGLVTALNTVYTKTVSLVLDTEAPQGAHYHPESNTIHLNKPSIITTLHEYAHALFGTSEKKACRWSVQLFAKVWPKSFANLEWNGHMLVRKPNATLAGASEDVDAVAADTLEQLTEAN
jgi:hypothetical protein